MFAPFQNSQSSVTAAKAVLNVGPLGVEWLDAVLTGVFSRPQREQAVTQ